MDRRGLPPRLLSRLEILYPATASGEKLSHKSRREHDKSSRILFSPEVATGRRAVRDIGHRLSGSERVPRLGETFSKREQTAPPRGLDRGRSRGAPQQGLPGIYRMDGDDSRSFGNACRELSHREQVAWAVTIPSTLQLRTPCGPSKKKRIRHLGPPGVARFRVSVRSRSEARADFTELRIRPDLRDRSLEGDDRELARVPERLGRPPWEFAVAEGHGGREGLDARLRSPIPPVVGTTSTGPVARSRPGPANSGRAPTTLPDMIRSASTTWGRSSSLNASTAKPNL